MTKEQILVVEDAQEMAEYLKTYFDWQGYDVLIASRGKEALTHCRLNLPSAIILDIILPDLSGYEVCRILRANNRTSHIPVIFLTERSKREDIITAFEVGADDYVVKPFDTEELRLRVEGAIRRSRHGGVPLYPATGLPTGEIIMDQLRALKDSVEPWAILYFAINNFEIYKEIGNIDKANQVLIYLADTLREAVARHGTPDDFLGQAADDGFVVTTIPEAVPDISESVINQFQTSSPTKIAQATGLVQLAVKTVTSYEGPFADIREITQMLAKQPAIQRLRKTKRTRPQPRDFDYHHQLAEQVALWQAAPELAQALIEAGNLATAKLLDTDRLNSLLDLADKSHTAPEALAPLRTKQRLCHLASENLRELPHKIQPYREVEPVPLLETLKETVQLLAPLELAVTLDTKDGPEIEVSLPKLKLQQAIYNLLKWLPADKAAIVLTVKKDQTTALVTFRGDALGEAGLNPSRLPDSLDQNGTNAVYGYLAWKIVSRYGGSLEAAGDRLLLNLPVADQPVATLTQKEIEVFWQNIKEQRLFLARKKQSLPPPHTVSQASKLVEPLAEDLLAHIETMLAALSNTGNLDLRFYPGSALQRYYQIYRLLILDLHRDRPLIPAPVNLKSLVESVKPLLAHRVRNHNIVIESDVARPVITSDQTRLSQILVNLGLNALEAMPEGGTLTFHIKANHYYLVEVSDTGTGIMPESLPYLFDPYFTTKGSGRGRGLHHVDTYIEQLHGQIEVSSTLGEGTTVTLKLPPDWAAGYF